MKEPYTMAGFCELVCALGGPNARHSVFSGWNDAKVTDIVLAGNQFIEYSGSTVNKLLQL
jgi:hypothetical protein